MSKDYSKISAKWKSANRNLGIFILYSRDVSLQPPFAEVLSGLLRAAYWPLVFLLSSFSGLFWPGPFFPQFSVMESIWIPKTVQRSSPSSPASFDGSAVLQAGELPSSGVT